MSDDWNNILANRTIRTLWLKNSDAEDSRRQRHAAVDALIGIKPADELEGMIASQMLAAQNAAMECYRRAMIGDQTFEGRRENLSQANKLSRGPTQCCSIRSIGIVARASRRLRWSTFTSTPVVRRWLAVSQPQGEGTERNQRIKLTQSKLAHAPQPG
jgi:hypothetical protein